MRTDYTAPQQALHRGARPKGPLVVNEADCTHFSAPVSASLALAIAHELKDWFPSMSRCISATMAKGAQGVVHPAFVSSLLARMFDEMVAVRAGKGVEG